MTMRSAVRTVLALFAAVLLSGCRTKTVVLPAETVTVEREVHAIRVDTVTVEVPMQTAERTTRDSVSYLATDWAESEASVDSTGLLRHWLRNKTVPHKVAVQTSVDTVYRSVSEVRSVPVEVERKPTAMEKVKLSTWWWSVICGACGWIAALVLAAILWLVARRRWNV